MIILRKIRVIAIAFLVAMLASTALFAQTAETGAIVGTVASAGASLPGVTVELRSPNLQGTRTSVTDSSGNFRFSLLPPGQYTLTTSLSGFNRVTQSNIVVPINHTVTLDVTINPVASEQITVTSAAPVVDVTSNVSGANVTAETMRSLPIGRNFVSAAQVAPGTSSDASGTTVYGSTGAENSYIIDGLNTTGVGYGQQGKRLNFDFIQEVEVMTGGLPAEYGRMTGGTINAVTKSGSNQFHGDAFGYDSSGGLTSKNSTAAQQPVWATTIGSTNRQYDYGVDLGGYVMKDRLWFFGAYNRVNQRDISTRINTPLVVPGYSVPVGGTVPLTIKRDLYAAKLSAAITANHQFNLSILGDPATTEGAQFAIAGPPSTFEGLDKVGGNDFVGRYSGIFGANFTVNAQAGRHQEKNEFGGAGATTSQIINTVDVPNTRTGGFGYFQNSKFKRDTAKLDVSAFFGRHEFKFGADQEDTQATWGNQYGGGDRLRRRCSVTPVNNQCPAPGFIYYIHEGYANVDAIDVNNPATFSANIIPVLASEPKNQNQSLYGQDSWKLLPNLTLNLGVRWESQKVGGRDGEWHIKLNDNLAPRIGLIFDPENNGRGKAYANYGRFYEAIPMDITARTFGGELSLQVANLNPASGAFTPDAAAPAIARGKQYAFLGNTDATPVDPNLKGQYIDEFILGYDHEVFANFGVGIKGTYRTLGRVIEDMLIDPSTGAYSVINPGTGLGSFGGNINGDPLPVPKAERKYTGVELHAQKRFSNNYQFFTSYVWSRLEGNYDGTFQNSTGQLDPNINSAYDYSDFSVNNNGLLSNDRTHTVKFYGSYTVPTGMTKGLDLGIGAHWESGVPLTAMGYEHAGYRNWEYYLTPRGSLGRGPSSYEADIHVGFPIMFGAGSRLTLLADVFNIFNRQSITVPDMRFNLSGDATCQNIVDAGGNDICNGYGGVANAPNSTEAVGQLGNARALATNPSFLTQGSTFTSPRSIRIGARISF